MREKREMWASVKEYGKKSEIFVIKNSNYSTKTEFSKALKSAGLIVKHISFKDEL